MTQTRFSLPQARGFLKTERKDHWWIVPILVLAGLGGFVIYSTWAAFEGKNFFLGGVNQPGVQQLLSPFYSPVLWDPRGIHSGHAWLGELPAWWPAWLLFSPALLILPFPAGFRFTCYYYRGAYYKAFWGDPASCTVGEPAFRGENYRGEQKFPLIFQNIHRYFLYVAILFIGLLFWDAYQSFWHYNADGKLAFGISVGTIVLVLNPIFLSLYTFGCHCMRHLVGGKHDCLSCSKSRLGGYKRVTWLNERHMLFAWISLFGVAFADIYVRMCANGTWADWRIL
ncbi:MAG: succinate dehydrogenase [Planctomycetota bacterium]|nr:succinate dehydrogenase [Planctomycetota bacterium]